MTTPNLNQLPPISDFDNAYVLAQQAHEQGFRGSTFADLYAWLKSKLDLLGISNTAGLPEAFPTDGAILTAANAGEWTILGPGIYHQPGYPSIEVAEGTVVFAQFDGTQFSVQREVEMPMQDVSELVKKADIINDLTVGGEDKVLSAEQGVELDNERKLTGGQIKGTRQEIVFGADGAVTEVKFINIIDNTTVERLDTFTYQGSIITEERTLKNGHSAVFKHDLSLMSTERLRSFIIEDLVFDLNMTGGSNSTDGWNYINDVTYIDNQITLNGYAAAASLHRHDLKINTNYGLLLDREVNVLTHNLLLVIIDQPTKIIASPTGVEGPYKTIIQSGSGLDRIRLATTQPETGYIVLKDIRLFELPEGTLIAEDFNNLSAEELNLKYPKSN